MSLLLALPDRPEDGASVASEAALVLCEIVASLDRTAARDLAALLAEDLATLTTSAIRESRLGLLASLIGDTGEVPDERSYAALRAARAELGEEWPGLQSLKDAYGSWVAVVEAAMRLSVRGSEGKVPYEYPNTGVRVGSTLKYTREEVVRALRACWNFYGYEPSSTEFQIWRRLRLAAWRASGAGGRRDPRIPSGKVVRRLFGGYQQLLAAERREREIAPPAEPFKRGRPRRTRSMRVKGVDGR